MCILVLFIYLGLFILFIKWVGSLITQNLDISDPSHKKKHSIQYMHEKFLAIAQAKREKAPKMDVNEIPKSRW